MSSRPVRHPPPPPPHPRRPPRPPHPHRPRHPAGALSLEQRDAKQEALVERYRELSLLVHQISGEQVEENTFNYLNSWVSDLRENVTRILILILTRSRL